MTFSGSWSAVDDLLSSLLGRHVSSMDLAGSWAGGRLSFPSLGEGLCLFYSTDIGAYLHALRLFLNLILIQ